MDKYVDFARSQKSCVEHEDNGDTYLNTSWKP